MSAMQLVAILCDGDESCDSHESVSPMADPIVARAMARQAGWTCDESGDWCPVHRSQAPRPICDAPDEYHGDYASGAQVLVCNTCNAWVSERGPHPMDTDPEDDDDE